MVTLKSRAVLSAVQSASSSGSSGEGHALCAVRNPALPKKVFRHFLASCPSLVRLCTVAILVLLFMAPVASAQVTANAGDDQIVAEGAFVTLDGGDSSGPGSALTYEWRQTAGTETALPVVLDDIAAISPTFTAGTAVELEFELTVSDGTSSDTYEVVVSVVPNTVLSFGTATISDRTFIFTQNTLVGEMTALHVASGGNVPLTYSIIETLPAGLSFNPVTRTISGTPTAVSQRAIYTYEVSDADADTVNNSVFITVNPDPAIIVNQAPTAVVVQLADQTPSPLITEDIVNPPPSLALTAAF